MAKPTDNNQPGVVGPEKKREPSAGGQRESLVQYDDDALTEPASTRRRRNDRTPTQTPDGAQSSLYQRRYTR